MPTCACHTQNGAKCKNPRKVGTKYCTRHQGCADEKEDGKGMTYTLIHGYGEVMSNVSLARVQKMVLPGDEIAGFMAAVSAIYGDVADSIIILDEKGNRAVPSEYSKRGIVNVKRTKTWTEEAIVKVAAKSPYGVVIFGPLDYPDSTVAVLTCSSEKMVQGIATACALLRGLTDETVKVFKKGKPVPNPKIDFNKESEKWDAAQSKYRKSVGEEEDDASDDDDEDDGSSEETGDISFDRIKSEIPDHVFQAIDYVVRSLDSNIFEEMKKIDEGHMDDYIADYELPLDRYYQLIDRPTAKKDLRKFVEKKIHSLFEEETYMLSGMNPNHEDQQKHFGLEIWSMVIDDLIHKYPSKEGKKVLDKIKEQEEKERWVQEHQNWSLQIQNTKEAEIYIRKNFDVANYGVHVRQGGKNLGPTGTATVDVYATDKAKKALQKLAPAWLLDVHELD